MFSAAELAQMRADIAQLFPDTCDVLEVTVASDSAGGFTETWGTVTGGSSVACRVDYRAGKESITGGAVTPYQQAVISLAYDETVTTENRIKVGDLTFSVISGNAGQSWKAVTRIIGELVP